MAPCVWRLDNISVQARADLLRGGFTGGTLTESKFLEKVKPHAMTSLLLVPLDDTVVFPTMDVTLPVRVGDEERVLLIPRHDGEFAKVGTIAEVTDHIRLPGGGRAVALSGVARGVAGAAHTDELGRLMIEVDEHADDKPVDGRTRNLEREYRAIIEEILELRGADDRIAQFLRAIADPGPLADTIGYSPDVSLRGQGPRARDARRRPTACRSWSSSSASA